MSRMCYSKCNCLHFNWRTGITTISIITETIQLTIAFFCIIILKCLKTHIDNARKRRERHNVVVVKEEEDDDKNDPLTIEAINELKAFYFIIIIYALVIFIFGIICSALLISCKCKSKAILGWLIYQGLFSASSLGIAYILIKVRDDERYVYKSMEHKTFYDLSTGIYWVTFVTFLPVLLYFWKRVLSIYLQMIKGKIQIQSSSIECNNNFLNNMGQSNSSGRYDDDDGDDGEEEEEGQCVAFIADSFVKNVTLDMEQ